MKTSPLAKNHRAAHRAAFWATRACGVFLLGLLAACRSTPPAAPAGPPPQAAYVVLGAGGAATARAIVTTAACPALRVDGTLAPMGLRAAAGTAAQRSGQAKASDFPVRVCEAALPAGAAAASIDGQPLPRVPAQVQRIVVLGDTGCRIKQAEQAYQDCSSASAWPLAAVAAAAAQERPDLVVHVGDYHYRESLCPPDQVCAGSPWGYGWDAWDADLFVPARTLMGAAPWVVTRGNHESCSRAGQGWFRFLDTGPYEPQRSCDAVADDAAADYTPPYAVPLGDHWQLIVFDSARATRSLDRQRPADAQTYDRYSAQMRSVAQLAAAPGMHSIFVSHHPVLGFAIDSGGHLQLGTGALLQTLRDTNGPRYFPAGVDLSLHGHVHNFQAIDFLSDHPATLVAGHGGDKLDRDIPAQIDATYPSAAGVRVHFIAHANRFGYLVLERAGAAWDVRARAVDGALLAHCTLNAAHLDCPQAGALSLPTPPAN